MSAVPNHHQRQFMQQLRGRGWVRAFELPSTPAVVRKLLQNGWIEARGIGRGLEYRITDGGMMAKKARIPVWGR